MSFLEITLALIIIIDPIGNTPIFVTFLKDFTPRRQQYIILREHLLSLGIMLLFCYLGENILQFLQVDTHSLHITSGIILFILAYRMIFPSEKKPSEEVELKEEPFLTPLAIPLISGPSVLASIMLFAAQSPNQTDMLAPIFIAWLFSLIVLISSPYVYRIIGNRGLIACERLMGMLLTLISVQYFSNGIQLFILKVGLLN